MEIKLKNIDYNVDDIQIIKKLNLSINKNQITSIVGPNGCGKTTIAQIMALQISPINGEITFNETPITNKKEIKKFTSKIGFIYQNPEEKFSYKTVREEIENSIDKFNYKTKDKEKRIKDSLKIAGLNESYLTRNPQTLSKGERQNLALATALSYNPKIIILDEPTANLDGKSKKQLLKLIQMMKLRYNKTIIIFSKDTDFIYAVSDYIYVINDGEVQQKGNKYKVFTNTKQLKQSNIAIPQLVAFSNLVEDKKNVKIGYRDDINDLMKDIYRYVR